NKYQELAFCILESPFLFHNSKPPLFMISSHCAIASAKYRFTFPGSYPAVPAPIDIPSPSVFCPTYFSQVASYSSTCAFKAFAAHLLILPLSFEGIFCRSEERRVGNEIRSTRYKLQSLS